MGNHLPYHIPTEEVQWLMAYLTVILQHLMVNFIHATP